MKAILRISYFLCFAVCAFCAPGDDDPTFFPSSITEEYELIQPVSDGVVVANTGGALAKLDLQGGVAPFNPPTLDFASFIYALSVDAQERLLAGIAAGAAHTGVVMRLMPDGTRDPEFAPVSTDNRITAIKVLPSQEILIAGHFKQVNGAPRAGFARLSVDGELDPNFAPLEGRVPDSLGLTEDGDYLISDLGLRRYRPDGLYKSWIQYGDSISFFGSGLLRTPDGGTWLDAAFKSAQILPDGAVDTAYQNPLWPQERSVAVQPDGRILIYGYDSTRVGSRFARLFADGSEDTSFVWNTNREVRAVVMGPNDTAYVAARSVNAAGPSFTRILLYDETAPTRIHFNRQRAAIGEGDTISLIVIRDGNASETSTVRFATSPGTATNDFMMTNGVVVFEPGERMKMVSVPTAGGASMQSDRTFTVTLSEPEGGALGQNGTVTVTILDRETSVNPGFAIYSISEIAGRIQYSFGRTGGTAYPARVLWKLEAENPSETNLFAAMEGETHFAALETTAFINLRVFDDAVVSTNRNFTLKLTSPDPHVSIASNTVVFTITENDRPNDPGRGVDGVISDAEFYTDGRLAISGEFSTVNGTSRPKLARLLKSGELDQTFNPPNFGLATLTGLLPVTEGKLVVMGSFTNVGAYARKYLVRLNEDGSVDESFDASAVLPRQPVALAVTTNGGFVVLGNGADFNGFRTGASRTNLGSIVKLDSLGRKDTNYSTRVVSSGSGHIATLPDDRVVIAGEVSVYRDPLRNSGSLGPILRGQLARLHPEGNLDTNFTASVSAGFGVPLPPPGTPLIRSLSVAADGDVLVTGGFTVANGAPVRTIARFNSNGSTDQPFTTNAGNQVGSSGNFIQGLMAADGRTYVIGADRNIRTVYNLVLGPDGKRDVAFGSYFDSGSDAPKSFWALSADGTSVLVNNYQRLIWFYSDGTRAANSGVALGTLEPNDAGGVQLKVDVRTRGTLVLEETSDFVGWREVLSTLVEPGLQTVEVPFGNEEHRFYRAIVR